MKILVFTVTAGEGHNVTAAAIKASAEARGHECEVVDLYRAVSPFMSYIFDKGYLLVSGKLNKLYGRCYRNMESRKSNSYSRSFTRSFYGLCAKKTKKLLDKLAPDAIISTHTYASMIVDIVKQRYGLSAKFFSVETDFGMHPCAEETLRADGLVVANEKLIPLALAKGFKEEQVLPIGISIREKFATSLSKAEARKALGLAEDVPTLLIMSGSMGHGNMQKTLRELDKLSLAMQIVVICGNNKKQKKKIDKESWQKQVFCLGFVNNIELYMDAADLIISKPGGLTTSEALAKRLPMLMCNHIEGQETRNVEFLLSCGAALAVGKGESLGSKVTEFFSHPSLAEQMRQSIEEIRKPNATADLLSAIEKPVTC